MLKGMLQLRRSDFPRLTAPTSKPGHVSKLIKVNKRVAELLVEHTLPMYNHGDKMFQQVYQKHNLKAYHPKEPLFYQDRINFESELTERWKPSRAFQPTSDNDFIRDCDRPEMLRRHERKMQEQTEIMAMQSKVSSVLFLNIDGVLNRQKTPSSLLSVRQKSFLKLLSRFASAR